MKDSIHQDMTKEDFIEYVKNSLAHEGYTHDNEILVRAVELMYEQDKKLIMFKQVVRMVRKHQDDVTGHLVGEKHV
jgi:hypothetical protein